MYLSLLRANFPFIKTRFSYTKSNKHHVLYFHNKNTHRIDSLFHRQHSSLPTFKYPSHSFSIPMNHPSTLRTQLTFPHSHLHICFRTQCVQSWHTAPVSFRKRNPIYWPFALCPFRNRSSISGLFMSILSNPPFALAYQNGVFTLRVYSIRLRNMKSQVRIDTAHVCFAFPCNANLRSLPSLVCIFELLQGKLLGISK